MYIKCDNSYYVFIRKTAPAKYKEASERFKLFNINPEERNSRLFCVKCKDILVEPYQSECGCRFCLSCIEHEIEDFCPGCDNVMSKIKNNIIYDKAVEKEIFAMEMICINLNCQHRCKLRDLVKHLEVCEFREGKCSSCGDLYLYKEEDKHQSVDCKLIKVKCEDCESEMTRKYFEEEHKNVYGNLNLICDLWRDVCPYKCCNEVQDSVKIHLKECPLLPVECLMKDVGCTKKLQRKDMDDHITTDVLTHMNLMMEVLRGLRTENIELKTLQLDLKEKENREMNILKETITKSKIEIKRLTDKIITCEKNYINLEKEATLLRQTLTYSDKSRFILKDSQSSPRSYGEFTWKIENIIKKIQDAKKGINVMILSEAFYSACPGYKMCLKIYPNGDGKGLDRFVSLYFVIMKGEYDDEISWPYKLKISLRLLANENAVNNHSMNLKPDVNELCYGKPSRDYNLAAGQPQFISHVELIGTGEFVENGAITIQARII